MAENLVATEAVNTLNDERARRLADRAALYAAGKNPYPEHSSVTDHAADLLERYEGLANEEFAPEVVTIGGRVVAKRGQGKIMFIVVRDPSADIQLFCRVNDVEEESWEVLKELDLGDIVQATGQVTRTKRGELSVAPRTAQLLSKAVRPLPEKFHGLSDKETRYRQRYVDLIVNEGVRETFRKRSAIVSAFRRYMEDNGYMEVETPILQSIQGGATAKPFITHFNALNQENYLRIATELHLKRLLVGGYERVFEIGRIFRNEGMDLTHNPEFTTMEAYRAYSDLEGMKELAEGVIKAAARAIGLEGMIDYQGQAIDLFSPWPSRPMTDVVSEVLGREVTIDTPVEELRAACDEHDIEYKPEWTAGKLIAELFDELGEAILINPTFVVDYPVEVSPLAKRHEDDPRLTHRFELFIAAHEYANAFSELNDPVDQAERFAAQMEEKAGGDDEAMEYDEDYVRALEYGMPPAGGIGIGIDRVVMLLTNSTSIRDVLLFPHMKPEKGSKSAPLPPRPPRSAEAAGARESVPHTHEAHGRLLQGGRRAAVRGLRRLRHLRQERLPRREGQGLRRRAQVQEAAELHPGRRYRHRPHYPVRHPRLLRAGGPDRQDAHRHHQPASAQDDGHPELRHDHLRCPCRGRGRRDPRAPQRADRG